MNVFASKGPLLPAHPEWTPGHSLPGAYYTSPEIFAKDVELLSRDWITIDHGSRIPDPGNFFTFNFAGESIVVVRGRDARVRAFYNVCRHRGSRFCLESEGTARSFTCPYHGWTYNLDGSLKGAALMPEDFDRKDWGLKECHAVEFHGLISLNLSLGKAPDVSEAVAFMEPYARLHGLKDAKIAVRRQYPTRANWKLALENFAECYHCRGSHPTYCRVHSPDKVLALGAGFGSADDRMTQEYLPVYEEWAARSRALGYPVDRNRTPIGPGKLTESPDGQPVSTLMGEFKEYDGGQTAIGIGGRLGGVLANNDHAIIFKFIPRDVLFTDVEAIWLVDRNAREGVDYNIDRLTELWEVTLAEDKTITENNQLGVESKAYEPGPYSRQENGLIGLTTWYAEALAEVSGSQKLGL